MCDILAFGIHPDDLEIGIFGTLMVEIGHSKTVGLVDLTAGEMGSNGTPEIRFNESLNASEILGAKFRIQLGLKDRGITVNEDSINRIVRVIREHRPTVVLYPHHKDYHPDHENGSRLIKESLHFANLSKYVTKDLSAYKVPISAMYYINDVTEPNEYVDISEYALKKRACLECHKSQFVRNEETVKTYLNDNFIDKVLNRDAYFGQICGVHFAEALHFDRPIAHQRVFL